MKPLHRPSGNRASTEAWPTTVEAVIAPVTPDAFPLSGCRELLDGSNRELLSEASVGFGLALSNCRLRFRNSMTELLSESS